MFSLCFFSSYFLQIPVIFHGDFRCSDFPTVHLDPDALQPCRSMPMLPFVLRCEDFFNLAGGSGRSLGTATNEWDLQGGTPQL